jgi:hypothetical protein
MSARAWLSKIRKRLGVYGDSHGLTAGLDPKCAFAFLSCATIRGQRFEAKTQRAGRSNWSIRLKSQKKSVNSRRSRRRAPFYANGELRDPTSICENPGQRLLSAWQRRVGGGYSDLPGISAGQRVVQLTKGGAGAAAQRSCERRSLGKAGR